MKMIKWVLAFLFFAATIGLAYLYSLLSLLSHSSFVSGPPLGLVLILLSFSVINFIILVSYGFGSQSREKWAYLTDVSFTLIFMTCAGLILSNQNVQGPTLSVLLFLSLAVLSTAIPIFMIIDLIIILAKRAKKVEIVGTFQAPKPPMSGVVRFLLAVIALIVMGTIVYFYSQRPNPSTQQTNTNTIPYHICPNTWVKQYTDGTAGNGWIEYLEFNNVEYSPLQLDMPWIQSNCAIKQQIISPPAFPSATIKGTIVDINMGTRLITIKGTTYFTDNYNDIAISSNTKLLDLDSKQIGLSNFSVGNGIQAIGRFDQSSVFTANEIDLLSIDPLPVTGVPPPGPSYDVPDKPVIYLYPTHKEQISVTLDYAGTLTAEYPSFNSGTTWNVDAYPDGSLINSADGKPYSYLFWEGQDTHQYDLSTGFVVKGSDTAPFLQNKLASIGLTPREYNEMIVYWLPKMQNNPYNLIHFAGSDYTNIAKLTVTPKPDSLLRVFMVWEPRQSPQQVQTQIFPAFQRGGFTVVEWGGTEL